MTSYLNWIKNLYIELPYTSTDILFVMIIIIFILYVAINEFTSNINSKTLTTLGSISFIFYLLHADFGYFIRTQYYLHFAKYTVVSEHAIMIIEIICSLILSYIILRFVDIIQNRVKIQKNIKKKNKINVKYSKK